MRYAREHDMAVFTHDLDFGAILFHTGAVSPRVIQLQCEDTRPATMGTLVLGALAQARSELESGAILTIDPRKHRLSLLPIGRR